MLLSAAAVANLMFPDASVGGVGAIGGARQSTGKVQKAYRTVTLLPQDIKSLDICFCQMGVLRAFSLCLRRRK